MCRFLTRTPCSSGCAAACATRCSAATTPRPCSSRSSGPTTSWCRWIAAGPGTAITTCSATCCAASSSAANPGSRRSSTAGRWPGARPTGSEPALHYAHEAGDTDAVTRLFEELIVPTYYAGGVATIERWLDWYDDELLERYPTIAVIGAWVHFLTGRPSEGARWERAAQRSTATPELPDGSASIEPWIAALRAYTCPDGIEQMLADCELALDQLGPEGWWRPTAQVAARPGACVPRRRRARRRSARARHRAVGGGRRIRRGQLCASPRSRCGRWTSGAWEDAAVNAERAVAIADEAHLDDYLSSGLARAAAARVAIQQGDVVRARENVAQDPSDSAALQHGPPMDVGPDRPRAHARPSRARRGPRRGSGSPRGGGHPARPSAPGHAGRAGSRAPATRRRPVELRAANGP